MPAVFKKKKIGISLCKLFSVVRNFSVGCGVVLSEMCHNSH